MGVNETYNNSVGLQLPAYCMATVHAPCYGSLVHVGPCRHVILMPESPLCVYLHVWHYMGKCHGVCEGGGLCVCFTVDEDSFKPGL